MIDPVEAIRGNFEVVERAFDGCPAQKAMASEQRLVLVQELDRRGFKSVKRRRLGGLIPGPKSDGEHDGCRQHCEASPRKTPDRLGGGLTFESHRETPGFGTNRASGKVIDQGGQLGGGNPSKGCLEDPLGRRTIGCSGLIRQGPSKGSAKAFDLVLVDLVLFEH